MLSHAGQAQTAGTVCQHLQNLGQARKTTAAIGTETRGSRPEQGLGRVFLPETDLGKSRETTSAPQQKRTRAPKEVQWEQSRDIQNLEGSGF